MLGKVAIAALLVVAGYLQYRLWVGEGSLADARDLQARVSMEKVVNDTLRERNRILRNEIIELKRGPESLEEKARVELGMVKDGETLFLIVED